MDLKSIKKRVARIELRGLHVLNFAKKKGWRTYMVVILPEPYEEFNREKYIEEKVGIEKYYSIPCVCGISLDGTPMSGGVCGMGEEDVIAKPTMQDYMELSNALKEYNKI
jgi:hypothetical protein